MLAVVDDKEQVAASQEIDEQPKGPPTRMVAKAKRSHHRFCYQRCIRDIGQLDEPHAVATRSLDLRRDPKSQPGLANSARADQRHQAARTQRQLEFGELAASPHKAVHLGREVAHRTGTPGPRHPTSLIPRAAEGLRQCLIRCLPDG